MTEYEAIEILGEFQTDKPILEMIYGDCHEQALEMAVKALEKRIPKDFRIHDVGVHFIFKKYRCGECNSFLFGEDDMDCFRKFARYCPHCGQKIDWRK